MSSVVVEKREISTPDLCPDCTNILKRVEQLQVGSLPVIDRSIEKADPEWFKGYVEFKDVNQFQESTFYKKYLPEDYSLEHKSTRTALLESADSGCQLCRWLLNSLDSRSRMPYSSWQTRYRRRPAVVRKDPLRSPLGMICIGHYYVSVRCAPDKRVWPVSLGKVGTDTHRSAYQYYLGDEEASLIIDSLSTVSKESPGLIRAIASLDEGSPCGSTWTLLESWLDLCTSGHSECRPQTSQHIEKFIPTRLLDIRDPELVRVVQKEVCFDSVETLRYATLSHCWGKTLEPQLNTMTSDSLIKGVHISGLPNTFSDAITVARKLKLPYLWIDALCILQDSIEDWLNESSKMGSIYRNSYLCIAGTMTKDNNSGFLARRDLTHKRPFIYHDLVVQEDVAMPNNKPRMKQITWCDRMRTLVEWGVERGPLNQRAWVIQERMFAPRILHCTSDEFIWECCKGMRSESHPLLTNGGSVVKHAWRHFLQASPSQELQLKQRKAFLQRWSEFIAIYSAAQLTRMDDKLIACSAIAKELRPILGNYAAGLWRDYLPTQLLWSHSWFCGVDGREGHHMRPRSKPSWSWASLDCRVKLPSYYDATRDPDFNTMDEHTGTLYDLKKCALVKVLDVNVDLRGEDPTGLVDGGILRLSCCQLLPLYRSAMFGWRLETEPPDAFEQNPPLHFAWDDPDDVVSAAEEQLWNDAYVHSLKSLNSEEENILHFDGPERRWFIHDKKLVHYIPTLTQRCCLPTIVHDKSTEGLILEHIGEVPGQFRRLGYFSCQNDYLDKIAENLPTDSKPEFLYKWPVNEKYNEENGYTISIV